MNGKQKLVALIVVLLAIAACLLAVTPREAYATSTCSAGCHKLPAISLPWARPFYGMPKLHKGMKFEDAKTALHKYKFSVRRIFVWGNKGRVIRWYPVPCAVKKKITSSRGAVYWGYRQGTLVIVEVGKGPKPKPKSPWNLSGAWNTSKASTYGLGDGCLGGPIAAPAGTLDSYRPIFAHKSMKFGTLVQFSHKGHSAIGICLDRGPYVSGRTFDLGPKLANVLHFNEGVGAVQWRVVGQVGKSLWYKGAY